MDTFTDDGALFSKAEVRIQAALTPGQLDVFDALALLDTEPAEQ